jgi:hypothetical protein
VRPEQKAALDYARRAGTEAPLAAIVRRLETTFAELDAELAAVTPEAAAWSPGDGRWSVRDVADHLVVSHRWAARQLAELVAGRVSAEGAIPAGLRSPSPPASPWSELAGELSRTHADFLRLVTATPEDTPLAARAPVEMVVRCAGPDGRMEPVHWIESFDWKAVAVLFRAHALEHLHQVRRILAAREL